MAEPRLLIDNDLFLLLSGAGLLGAALKVLAFQRGQIEILPALPHTVRKKKLKQLSTDELVQQVLTDCETCGRVQPPSVELLDRLNNLTNIDPGEAILLGRLVESPGMLLATGDKRALIAFTGAAEIADLRDAVAGRVVCLEILLQKLVVKLGVESVATAFRVFPDHKSLRIIFSSKNSTDQEACLSSLDSYLRDLNRSVGDDFFLST